MNTRNDNEERERKRERKTKTVNGNVCGQWKRKMKAGT